MAPKKKSECPLCAYPDNQNMMMCTGECGKYHHFRCIKMTRAQAEAVAEGWRCDACIKAEEGEWQTEQSTSDAETTMVPRTMTVTAQVHNSQPVPLGPADEIVQGAPTQAHPAMKLITNAAKSFKRLVTGRETTTTLHANAALSTTGQSQRTVSSQASSIARGLEREENLLARERELLDAKWDLLQREKEFNQRTSCASSQASSRASSRVSSHTRSDPRPKPPLNPKAITFTPQLKKTVSDLSQLSIDQPRQRPKPTPYQQWMRPMMKELPAFSGDPEEWPMFIRMFESSTERYEIEQEDNLWRLQKCLKGEARKAVQSLLVLPENVPDIIEHLELKFGRPKLIIARLLEELKAVPNVKDHKLDTLIELATKVRNLTATLTNARMENHLMNPTLIEELEDKLSPSLRLKWAEHIGEEEASLVLFDDWMRHLARCASRVTRTEKHVSDTKPEPSRSNAKTGAVHKEAARTHKQEVKVVCPACLEDCVDLNKCKIFKGMPDAEKWTVLRNAGICKQCLTKHVMRPPYICKLAVRCDHEGCKGKHHPLMHSDDWNQGKEDDFTSYSHRVKGVNAQFRYIPVVLRNGDEEVTTYAFCDEGSNGTFLEEGVAHQLKLTGPKSNLHVQFTGESFATVDGSMLVDLQASGTFANAKTVVLSGVRTVRNLNLQKQTLDYKSAAEDFPYLKGLPVEPYQDVTPTLLIGLNNWDVALTKRSRSGKKGDPVAAKCDLGWSIYAQPTAGDGQSIHHCCTLETDTPDVRELIQEFLSIDSLGVQPPPNDLASQEERRAMDILRDSTTRNGDRYTTGLLWRHDDISLPDSKPMAMKRLNCLQARMERNPEFAEAMHQQVEGFIEKGYVRELTEEELKVERKRVCYLPLFAHINPNKPGKVRIVADAAAKVNGVSLNSALLKGPDIGPSLFGILLRFRERRKAFTGDTKEMFQQVLVNEEDQHAQRFLWIKKGTTKPSTFVFQVLTFGATCSPACAKYVRDLNADKHEADFPTTSAIIKRCTYTDDLLVSVDDDEDAIVIIDETKLINQQASFEIRGWKSNSEAVMKHIDTSEANHSDPASMNVSNDGVEKVLGMWWTYATTDEFTFLLHFNKGREDVLAGRRAPTRRGVMSILMSVYDPLGLIAHFLAYLKVLLQEVCRYGLQWDDPLENELLEQWNSWLKVLHSAESLRIPRCILGNFMDWQRANVQLHLLCDASKDCCAAVAYLRVEQDGYVHVVLISAKTKVAPLRLTSIPKLELNAALMAARLARSIRSEASIPISKTIYWSDSKPVLGQIRTDVGRIQGQYVAFRVCEIQEITDVGSWRYVPTKLNVADDATKWKRLRLEITDRWFQGPPFLKLSEEEWPVDTPGDTEETNRVHQQHVGRSIRLQSPLIEYTRFSKWTRMIRSAAYVRRGTKSLVKKPASRGPLAGEEIAEAERYIIRAVQHEMFPDEVTRLYTTSNEESVNKSSPLYPLSPYLDDDGIMRVKGRIDAAEVAFDTKRPVIMPRQHWATVLLVRRCHEKYNHMNHETVIDEVRRTYHISRLRQFLKSIRHHCARCAFLRARAAPPCMAPIPRERLMPYTPPFTYCGCDCCGPFLVLVGRHHEKRWIVLFTCLVTRAVHLEVVHGMDYDHFILAFRNFTQRRGTPMKMFSDNGTNFVKGERVLREETKRVAELVRNDYANKGMSWHFNPPDAPHMGGIWERLVKSVKHNLYAVQLSRTPSDPLFASYVIEVENIINSRPLTYLPIDSEQSHALTPNDFLRGGSGANLPLGLFDDNAKLLKGMWRMAQVYANRFWRRWVAEYLPELTLRSKWYEPAKPIEPGDLVLIVDANAMRNEWKRGRVSEVRTGSDGQVRSAVVQTSTSELVRPAVKLAVLDIDPQGAALLSKQIQQGTGGQDVGNSNH